MKCLKCGAVNKKTNEKCKVCGEPLQEEIKKDTKKVKEKTKKEPKVEEVKTEIKEEVKVEETQEVVPSKKEEKKKSNIFRKLWFTIKLLIGLLVLAVIGLSVYVYGFYDYTKYFEDNMNRYYETEAEKYLDNLKLVFRIYNFNDSKIEKLQEKANDIVDEWILDIEEKDYKSKDEYEDNIEYLQNVVNALYEKTDVKGHTAINKKSYINLTYKIKGLNKNNTNQENSDNEYDVDNKPSQDDNDKEVTDEENDEINNEENKEENTNNKYDVSMMDEVSLKQAINLFNSKKTYVLYIGRDTCEACVLYLPALQKAQKEYSYTTKYLDIATLTSSDPNFEVFKKKLSYDYTLEGEEQTFGDFIGFTPMTIIIKGGKQVDGVIGAIDYEDLSKMLEKNGITK